MSTLALLYSPHHVLTFDIRFPVYRQAQSPATPESCSTASPEPARASPAAGGHVNPTFVITEESDFESEPPGRRSSTATPPSPSPPESERSTRRSSEESCSSAEAAQDATGWPSGKRSGAGAAQDPAEKVAVSVPLPTISITVDEEAAPEPDREDEVTISRL